MNRILAVFSIAVLSGVLISCQSTGKSSAYMTTVSVTGRSEVSAAPDSASFSVHAEAVRDTGEEARRETARIIKEALSVLSESGVAGEDLVTGYMSMNPYYEWVDGRRELKGQMASERIDVTLDAIESIGTVYDRLSAIDGLSLSSAVLDKKDKSGLQKEARMAAVEDAEEKARTYAAALGLELGAAVSVSDGTEAYAVSLPRYENAVMAKAAASDSISSEYYAGKVTVSDRVSVVFELK